MSANVEGMVREGANAAKAGRRDEARSLLQKAVELDQYNEEAWLWLSGVVDSIDDQRTCLENVLSINPDNDKARVGLQYLGINPPAPVENPFSTPSNDPFAPPSLNTSVEWGSMETSSPSAVTPRGKVEPSPGELDDWVSNLNLPLNAQASPLFDEQTAPPSGGTSANPFGDIDFGLDDDELTDDLFSAGGVFDSAAPAPSALSPMEAPPRESRRARRDRDFEPLSDPDRGNYGDTGDDDPFALIPDEIAPTRLPGTVEGASALHYVLVAVLVLVNIGVAVYAMSGILPA